MFFLFQVYVTIPDLRGHLSPSIYGSLMALIAHLEMQESGTVHRMLNTSNSVNVTSKQVDTSIFGFFVSAKLESFSLHVDLENNASSSSLLTLAAHNFDFWFVTFLLVLLCLCFY